MVAGIFLAAAIISVPAKASASVDSSSSITCFGSVTCAGQDPASTGCDQDQTLLQDQQIPGAPPGYGVNTFGDIDLYESESCSTAWAVLHVSPNAYILTSSSDPTSWPYLAEIFYESPLGGAEQFNTARWDGKSGDVATTTMVPLSGSVKACGGDPNGSGDPFDEDPQAIHTVIQDPVDNGTYYPLTAGACTFWH